MELPSDSLQELARFYHPRLVVKGMKRRGAKLIVCNQAARTGIIVIKRNERYGLGA